MGWDRGEIGQVGKREGGGRILGKKGREERGEG